ncbi:MAG: hypothetical protein HY270_09855 [Deltaproteobacteria bacterium]|nr:hypothetical protein [Deltaproteobacteria bacterium]
MWNRRALLALADTEARQLAGQPVSEVIPSRRDFAQYVSTQRSELAAIARLEGGPLSSVLRLAKNSDDAEVAALTISAQAREEMATIAAAVTAPILREAFVVDANQLYRARLGGADAALFPAAELGFDVLQQLTSLASSLHMASIGEVFDRSGLEVALRLPRLLLGLACADARGQLDIDATRMLAASIDPGRTLLVLPPLQNAEQADALRGSVDAVTLSEALLDNEDLPGLIERIRQSK